MSNNDLYEVDPLFAGVTRPSMVMGVTLEAFIIGFMSAAIIFLISGNPLYLLIYIPFHLICAVICVYDPRSFSLFFLWVKTKGSSSSRRWWKASSRTPLVNTRRELKKVPYVRC